MDKDGISAASSDEPRCPNADTCPGRDKSGDVVFANGRKGFYIKDLYKEEENPEKIVLSMSFPIFNNGKFLGVISAKMNPDRLYEITSSSISKTIGGEEVYLVNSNHCAITPLRYASDAVLNKKVETLNTKNCFSAMDVKESQYLSYKDVRHIGHEATAIFMGYNGTETIGTHAYMPATKWCLLVEAPKNEAFVSINYLFIIACALTFFIFSFSLILSLIAGKILAKPIERLHKGAEIIAKGDLGYKVSIKSRDEIGQLSRAFDKMTDTIKKTYDEVDKKVKEQTKKLEEHQRKIEEAREKTERINKAMVGREIKMIELKEELEKIKKEKK